MEEYKLQNAELVAEACRLRGVISERERTILELQSQLLEEHRQRVEQQRRLVKLMTDHFKQAVRAVNPDEDVLRLLTTPENSENMTTGKRCSSQSIARQRFSVLPLSSGHHSDRFESSPEERYVDGDCDAKDLSSLTPVMSPASDPPEQVSVESRSISNIPSLPYGTTRESSPHIVVQDITLTSQQGGHIDETNPTCSSMSTEIPPQDTMSLCLPLTQSIFDGNLDFPTSTPRPSWKEAAIRLSKSAVEPETDDRCVISLSRSQRSCKPANLKEQKLNIKLRGLGTPIKKKKSRR